MTAGSVEPIVSFVATLQVGTGLGLDDFRSSGINTDREVVSVPFGVVP